MATNTTNYALKKPAYSDTADIMDINGNMDKVDTALQGIGSGLAIISNKNTHAAITSGQYVYVHGHNTLPDGMYKAKSNIAANGTLSTSNLDAISDGGLNNLDSKRSIKSYSAPSKLLTEALAVDDWAVINTLNDGDTDDHPSDGTALVLKRAARIMVTLYGINNRIYQNTYDGSLWSGWVRCLRDDEVTGFAAQQVYYGNETSVTFSVPSNTRYLIMTISTNPRESSMFLLSCSTTGTVATTSITQGSNVSISTAVSKLTIGFTDAGNRNFTCLPLSQLSNQNLITKD